MERLQESGFYERYFVFGLEFITDVLENYFGHSTSLDL